jgi:type IV secretory pathway VirB4 component
MATGFGNSQDLVEIKDIRDNIVILKDGSLRQVLLIGGINFSLKSEEEQNILTQTYQNFLNSIEFPVQIVIHSRKINIQKYLDDLEKRRSEEQSPLLQNQIAEYREFVRQFVEQNAIMEKSFLFIVSWYPTTIASAGGGLLGFLPFGKKKDDAAEKAVESEGFKQNAAQLGQRVSQVLEGLTTMGLESAILTTEELEELFYNFYNPGAIEREGLAPTPKNG